MLVEMVLTGKVKDVKPEAAGVLIKAKAARPVYQTRALSPETVAAISDSYQGKVEAVESVEEISPRTGKPKRRYKRRDIRAED